MHTELEKAGKKFYATPQLTVHGTVEEITAAQNKDYGPSDGFTFQGVSITNIS
jgi:hypothetical protein